MAYYCIPINSTNKLEVIMGILKEAAAIDDDHKYIDSFNKVLEQIERNNTLHEIFFELDDYHTTTSIIDDLLRQYTGKRIYDYQLQSAFISKTIVNFIHNVGKQKFLEMITPETQEEFNNFELFYKWCSSDDIINHCQKQLYNNLVNAFRPVQIVTLYYKLKFDEGTGIHDAYRKIFGDVRYSNRST